MLILLCTHYHCTRRMTFALNACTQVRPVCWNKTAAYKIELCDEEVTFDMNTFHFTCLSSGTELLL